LTTLVKKEKIVRNVIEKKNNSVTGITQKDQRGPGPSHNKISEAVIMDVHRLDILINFLHMRVIINEEQTKKNIYLPI